MPTLASADAPRKGFAPPPEVTRYFSDKGLRPAFSWLDVWQEEHAHAFTVAKVTELDMLATLKASIETAIAKGQTFETWREGLKPELQTRGWWGPREVADPTGARAPKTVDISTPRRMRTIFDTNMRAARAAGQWERIQKSKRALPQLLYVRTTSSEPRKAHLAFVGLVLPVDDAFWRTHFPPNGWGCKCAVRQISAREAQRYLSTPGYTDKPGKIVWEEFVNARTGAVERVPAGIDPGFGWNPGMAQGRQRKLADMLEKKLQDIVGVDHLEGAARAVVQDVVQGDDFARLHQGAARRWERRKALQSEAAKNGVAEADAKKMVQAAEPWSRANTPVAIIPARVDEARALGGHVVTVSDEGIGHSFGSHRTTAQDWTLVQTVIDHGEIQRSAAPEEADRMWAFLLLGGKTRVLSLVLRDGAWRVMTYFEASSKRYAQNQLEKAGRYLVAAAEGEE